MDGSIAQHASFVDLHYKLMKWHPNHRSMMVGIWCFVQAHRHMITEALQMLEDFEGNPDMEQRYHHLAHIHSLCEALEVLVAAMYNERLDRAGEELTEVVVNCLTAGMNIPSPGVVEPEPHEGSSEAVNPSTVSMLERLFNSEDWPQADR